jgi:hypothetical protein
LGIRAGNGREKIVSLFHQDLREHAGLVDIRRRNSPQQATAQCGFTGADEGRKNHPHAPRRDRGAKSIPGKSNNISYIQRVRAANSAPAKSITG